MAVRGIITAMAVRGIITARAVATMTRKKVAATAANTIVITRTKVSGIILAAEQWFELIGRIVKGRNHSVE
jgi:hypothetical protein